MEPEFQRKLNTAAGQINETLNLILDTRCSMLDTDHGRLQEALRYVIEGKGKRIRGALVLWCCEVISGAVNRDAQVAAAAVEMVHAYSLVHDDLPAMDDDALRRGRASCHKKFDEATAILAGDGLLTLAFEVLAEEIQTAEISVKLSGQLARAAGPAGMLAGQAADLAAERTKMAEGVPNAKKNVWGAPDPGLLEYIHTHKTARMFECAVLSGGICGGADKKKLRALSMFGLKLGLGFQVADDILDTIATSKQLGKTAGKDAKVGKMTYPGLFGLERARQLAEKLTGEAIEALVCFGPEADILREMAVALLNRSK